MAIMNIVEKNSAWLHFHGQEDNEDTRDSSYRIISHNDKSLTFVFLLPNNMFLKSSACM